MKDSSAGDRAIDQPSSWKSPRRRPSSTAIGPTSSSPHAKVSSISAPSQTLTASPRLKHIPFVLPTSSPESHAREIISGDRKRKQAQFRILSQAVRCYVLPEKLSDDEVQDIHDRVESLGALTTRDIKYANLMLTDIRAPKRATAAFRREQLAANLDDGWMAKIPVLHTTWLDDTSEKKIMQSYDAYRVVKNDAVATDKDAEDDLEHWDNQSQPDEEADNPGSREASIRSSDNGSVTEDESQLTSSPPAKRRRRQGDIPTRSEMAWDAAPPPWRNSELACERPSPLVSEHNQGLVHELDVIRKQRALTSQQWSERSYSGCISAVKAYPKPVCSENLKTVMNLKGVGKKMIGLIDQYCQNGKIVEAEQIRGDPANEILFGFMDLYGIGPVSARSLYEDGCRTFEDVIAKGRSLATQLDTRDCYRILPDLKTKIPRVEVEEIARLISAEMEKIAPGTFYEICGGYRRGKPQSNDVDIVLSNSSSDFSIRLDVLNNLLDVLKRKGLMSYAVTVSASGTSAEYETTGHLDLAEIVFLPPQSAVVTRSRHRRVDLIFCSPKVFGAAVLGWTGSRHFEIDLRRWAQRKGYKFHNSGLTERASGKIVETRTEMDVFKKLGLPYMPPQWRNCDA